MTLSFHRKSRPAAILCVFLVLAGCTKRVAVTIDQLEIGEHTNKTYSLQLKDGREIVSDHVTIADSVLVLHNVIAEGKRTAIEPDHIPMGNVESIEAIEMNWLLTAVVLTPIAIVGVLMLWFILELNDPGGGLEGQGG
jgi:hypothetical protein